MHYGGAVNGGENMETAYLILTNELVLSFKALKVYAKFRQNRTKAASARTDCSMDSFREGLEPPMLGVCNLSLKD